MSAAFWTLAPIMVIAALGILFVRKAVHAALLLAVVMISLAVQYAALDATFLFAVQIVVYTGAILTLFLFVVMLVGVDASDSIVETIRGQRLLAIVGGLVLGLTLVIGVAQMSLGTMTGLTTANKGGNIQALANLIFSRYVFAFEVTSALLITAAIGAMVLAHRERLDPKVTQAGLAAQRIRAFSETGEHPGPLPPPGTYARHNAVDTPALLPDGTTSDASVNRVLAARGAVRTIPQEPGLTGLDTPSPSGSGYSTSGSEGDAGSAGRIKTEGDAGSAGRVASASERIETEEDAE
ncbi:NADH-quinone oxidoreductase subunit J [Nocardioides sp. CER19]|uniref:NADH-quinone oxidoreductase subunit J n=1 Tax=Nocardioides sp. CER19 TaxID=3038538 RepID=UPI0024498508|nr:NADH-quinone oxidoreductase subunit J [Nocardioides sp. CER19]MDH2414293.1 NADH-quinone oxidoreductase subunit J [Nocardioides sp. CER19]